nr:protein bassoon [Zonotrichia albicollis]
MFNWCNTLRRPEQLEQAGGQRSASPSLAQPAGSSQSPREMRGRGQPAAAAAEGPRRTLQVDARSQGSGRSPSVSPERGSTPTSPYSVPQIAPLPSSTLCPICKTTELTSSPGQPNFNACTQCHSKVCNQCGFNPNPHLTQVKEWLCLNCQMQRALGMDMTTAPRSKSQQQLHSPSPSPSQSPAKHPQPPAADKTPPAPRPLPQEQPKPQPATPQREPHGQGQPKPQEAARSSPQHQARASPQHQQAKPSPSEQRKTQGDAGAKPAAPAPGAGAPEQPQEGLTGKLFGFGASLLTQASTLMSVQPEAPAPSQPSPGKVPPKIVFSDASKEAGPKAPGAQGRAGAAAAAKPGKAEQGVKPKEVPKARVSCPLCKAEINVGSAEPPNYNTCTTCRQQVCNMCGFNPTPHLVEKNEWLCLNCQTQRLLEGSLGDPAPMPLPTPKPPSSGSPRHQPPAAGQQRAPTPAPVPAEAAPPEQQPSPARSLRAAEQGRTPSPAPAEKKPPPPAEKKPPVPAEEKPLPKAAPEPSRAPESVAPKGKSMTPKQEVERKESQALPEAPRAKEQEDGSKPYPPDLSRSPQSLSDTGYSSDGISSSQSEITGLVQQEEEKLSSTGLAGQSPPSPSELTKLESSMRPLLEGRGAPTQSPERSKSRTEQQEDQRQQQRPRYLSITPEAFDSDEELEDILEEDEEWDNQRERRESAESSDEFGSKLRHDYVEDSSEGGFSPVPPRSKGQEAEVTDEEFMRRQILEMSAEEDNLEEEEEGYGRTKYSIPKAGQKSEAEKGKEPASAKRRLPHGASSMYTGEESKEVEAVEGDDLSTAQGGLRRFKTIELNSTTGYGREMEIGQEPDTSVDREPELEMESLTGSPEERSRGEYSSTLPATTPSYTSGTSPTSISSLEEDSDSSPSRRQRLEEVKQQRKARHRSHGPLLPTIEDSSEEEEMREEEELLREQEKMREVEQQRIRSTARKTKRDKEELRAQRRRERSKTPPSNLSPIEDASPTEELRQAAEMEELHRSSCSEYSPSIDSEAESFDAVTSKLYKSGSEYNLPTFMSLYSPTEKVESAASQPISKPLKSAEEAYEEMMRKAEMMQKQQVQQAQPASSYSSTFQQVGYRSTEGQNGFDYQYGEEYQYDGGLTRPSQPDYSSALPKAGAVYEEILQTSKSISRMHQSSSFDLGEKVKGQEEAYQEKHFLNAESAYADLLKQNGGPLTPGTSPTQLSAPVSFASSDSSTGKTIPDVRVTQHFAKEGQDLGKLQSAPAAPSPVSKVTTTPYAYSKGTSTVTTAAGSPGSALQSYSSPSPEAPSIAGRSYTPSKSTVSYGSQTEDTTRTRTVEISVQTAREKIPAVSDSKPTLPKTYTFFKSSSPPLSPTSPTQSPTRTTKATAEFSTQTQSPVLSYDGPSAAAAGPDTSSPMVAQGTQTPHRAGSPRLTRQASSQDSPFMVITLAADAASQTKPVSSGALTSPTSSPTRPSRQLLAHGYTQTPEPEQPTGAYIRAQPVKDHAQKAPAVTSAPDGITGLYSWGALPAENISLCRISSIPGTSRVEPGPKVPSSNAVDLRTALKSAPIIITDQGMDLTSLATEARKYCLTLDHIPNRQSTAIQPLIINLNAQEQPHAIIAAASTASLAIASPMILSQSKQPMVYGDPFQSRVDFGQGTGSPVCLAQVKQVEQGVQTATVRASGVASGKPEPPAAPQTKFARYGMPGQMVKKDVLLTQTGGAQNASGLPQAFPPEPGSEVYRAVPVELKSQSPLLALGGKKSQVMMVQMEEAATGPVTKVLKEEGPANVLDLTGVKPESQVACCDMVYKFPFGGSCTGAFNPTSKMPEKKTGEAAVMPGRKAGGPMYGSREPELPETFPYREQPAPAPALYEEQKFYPASAFGRLYSSMSDTNLSEIGMSYYHTKGDQPFPAPAGDAAVDLSTMKHSYSVGFAEGGYLGQGPQYGSFSDLRQPGELLSHPFPMRRYSSASNLYSDYRFSHRGDLASFQESSLAHYSATTAREISRMCAALNSMDQYGGRHANGPDVLPYGPSTGQGATGGLAAQQQGPVPPKPGGMYNPTFPEGRQGFSNLAQYNVPGVRLGAIRQMLPSTATVRAADGMIYSTINTPIASTLPITTVRRRRSRASRHTEASTEGKTDGATRTASVGIQTISDCSVQTEPDQLLRVSPSIHITTHDPRVEIVKYISAPEKTQRGESLACQTEPEPAPQPGVVVPQLTVPTTIPPYSTSLQIVSTGPLDPHAVRQQTLGKFEKKKPDPLEIGYQSHLPAESLSQLVTRQPPRSPQVLYSPVSPLSPHRLLESSFATSERLNKAHVPPQKHFTTDLAQRQQTLPRPIKTMQRSLSDPKPISPTSEEAGKDRFSLYQHPLLPSSQVGGLQSSSLARKVKRTLPSPPPEEPHVPLASPAASQLYLSSLAPKATAPVTKASLLKELDRDLRLVEHEATKLRKKQAELDEEEKEIDAKLKYLELGITQRKESLLKDRVGGRDHPYLRYPGDPADIAGGHQKPRQTSLADLEQKIPTNYEVIGAATSSSAVPDVTFSSAPASSGYEQYKAPESRPAERTSTAPGPSASYSSESLYTNLEQNIPRNYVMIEDISELTKESPAVDGQKAEPVGTSADSRHSREKSDLGDTEGSSRPCCYTKAEEESEEDMYDHHGPDHRGKNSYYRGTESNGRVSGSSTSSSYYYGDSEYRHSSRMDKHSSGTPLPKHSSKNLAPAVISSKRSKHRKQGMEQKISKFSPIEEAKDVESDLASYSTTTSIGSSNVASRAKKLQDEITYGLKKNVYEQQKYYGVSSRDLVDEEERVYSSSSRTRSSGYGVEKSSSREMGGRSKSYERESMERSQKVSSKPSSLSMSQSRGRAPMRSQHSEEESPVSPMGRSMGGSRTAGGPGPQSAGDPCSQFCSSHSLPDVQKHIKDVPRSHSYKHEEGYGMDDAHCVVSDSEAYHLGQEETDWFDKPREARAERVRHYGGHSSSQKRPPVKHTYHDYDEPPDEDPWQHDDYPQHREHRHHRDYDRHAGSSRHANAQPGGHPAPATKVEPTDTSKPAAKVPQQPGRAPSAQPLGAAADSKAGPRAAGPRGPAGMATGQPGGEGESVFSKILPGGAAEQAGKLTEAVSAFGKKFTSFW